MNIISGTKMKRAVTLLRQKQYALLSTEDSSDLDDAVQALKDLGFNITMDVKFEE